MESIHFEKQEASLCAQHAVNMLLQGAYFTAVDLAEIASDVDNREDGVLNEPSARSHNVDDSGYFSVQVIAEALKVFNLELIQLNSARASAYRNDPTLGQAYICNLNEHWFAVRRLGFQWFTLNSLLPMPRLISDTYLSLFFAQLINDGYSIFVVEGDLPPCIADEQLTQCPVDPSLASISDSYRDDQSEDPNIARAKAISSAQFNEDKELQLALELSRQALEDDMLRRNQDSLDDEQQERQLQKAIQMSMESWMDEHSASQSTATSSAVEKVAGNLDNQTSPEVRETKESKDSQIAENDEVRRRRENFLKRFEK